MPSKKDVAIVRELAGRAGARGVRAGAGLACARTPHLRSPARVRGSGGAFGALTFTTVPPASSRRL